MQKFVALFMLFSLIACGGKKVPDDILPPQQMEKIVVDFIKADELSTVLSDKDTAINRQKKRYQLYGYVLQIHKLSKKEFQKNLKFYQGRPDLLKVILDSLHENTYQMD